MFIRFRGEEFIYPAKYRRNLAKMKLLDGEIQEFQKQLDELTLSTEVKEIVSAENKVNIVNESTAIEVAASNTQEIAEKVNSYVVTDVKKPKSNMKMKVATCLVAVGIIASVSPTCINSEQEAYLNQQLASPSYEYVMGQDELAASTSFGAIDIQSVHDEDTYTNINEIIKLGDEVVLKDGSPIYSDSYKATNNSNELNRYFPNNEDRVVSGLTYNLNGNLTTIYSSDADYQSKVNNLVSNGAEVSAVLISNENGVEGYMSINDIDNIVTEKGFSR